MATTVADSMDEDADSGSATFERKRPHNIISRDDASNVGSAHSTPRKRVKNGRKLSRQGIRDFVPVGASFSTSAVPVEKAEDSSDEGFQAGTSLKTENLSNNEAVGTFKSDAAEHEGRRLLITDLPPNITEKDLKQFFEGYSVENIWIPDLIGDNSQLVTIAQKENLSLDGDSHMINSPKGTATAGTNDGNRLYVGNLPYTATVEDLRDFFREFSLKNITVPVNPRTGRPVGYAFVTVSTPDEADRATSQLSGHEILDRKVSVQRARVEETRAPDPGNTAAKMGASTIGSERTEGHHGFRNLKAEKETEEDNVSRKISEIISPPNWNSVNTTKIRTTLGKIKDLVDEPSLSNRGRKEAEGHSDRDLATSVALERIEGLRIRLSALNPHDGPVSAYKSTQQELYNAKVDYNYCQYFPAKEPFQPPPHSTARNSTQETKDNGDYSSRMWSLVEQCMKEGTLQDLNEGRINVSSVERSGQLSPGQNSAFESLDGLEQTNSLQILQTSTRTPPDTKQIRKLETQETSRKQQGYLKAFPHMRLGSHNYEKMKKKIHETEIHLNYCQYFPAAEDYLPLALARKGLNELNSSNLKGIRASERRAAQIWKLVEQCAQDGNLQDLRDGRLAALLKDAPPPSQSFALAQQARHSEEFAEMAGLNHKPQQDCGREEASKRAAGAASANVKPIAKQEGEPGERQGTSESDAGVILNLDYANEDVTSKIVNKVVQLQPVMNSRYEDEEMPIDVHEQDIKQELPAMGQVDDDLYASDSGAASDSGTESNDSIMDRDSQSEDDNAITQDSDSDRISADKGERDIEMTAIPPSHKAHILADLNVYDLNTQLKYFHTTKVREEVDGNTLVRCLVCTKEGHMAGICESLTCSVCGAFNQHLTQACPNNTKCAKCREEGHDESHCKLGKMRKHEIVCDLCQRNGHVEEDCELIWRTSGRPWDFDLANANVQLSCYECGRSGHLGNDCPSRKPNKSMGTSTWDGSKGQVSIESTREIKIKGKATQQDPINIDDSDDDRANFFRPKISVPEPVRKGQIRIITGRRESPIYETTRSDRQGHADHRRDSVTPLNESYRDDGARRPYQQYRDGRRGDWRAGDVLDYGTGHNDSRYDNYRASERRSRSPSYRDHGGYAGENSWPPPRAEPRAEHQDRRPAADANVYRPMPSAAQKAWTRRRV